MLACKLVDLSKYLPLEDPSDLVHWVFTNLVPDELDELFRDDKEEKLDGYLPYQVDLGLTFKLAYSSVANYNILLFCLYNRYSLRIREIQDDPDDDFLTPAHFLISGPNLTIMETKFKNKVATHSGKFT